MEQQEMMIKMQMIEQEAQQLQEKMQLMDDNIQEMHAIKTSMDNLETNNKGEMLANLGKGIFIKTEIKDKELFVNTGKGVIIKKSIKETKQILDEQIQKLMGGKEDILKKLGQLQMEMQNLFQEAQSSASQEQKQGQEEPAAKVKKSKR